MPKILEAENNDYEYSLTIDSFMKEKTYLNNNADVVRILHMIFMKKGTIPDEPNAGFDLTSRRHMLIKEENLEALTQELLEMFGRYSNVSLADVEFYINNDIENNKGICTLSISTINGEKIDIVPGNTMSDSTIKFNKDFNA